MNATLTLSAWEFNAGLKQSETAAMEFASTVEVQSRRADAAFAKSSGGGKNFAAIAQQAGYAIQDFSSQFETRGLAGGIGAVTNNLQAMGASLGPTQAAVISMGAAIAGMVLPAAIDLLYQTKHWNEELERSKTIFDGMAAKARTLASLEVKGGVEAGRKELEQTAAMSDRMLAKLGPDVMREANKLNAMRQKLDERTLYTNMWGGRVFKNPFNRENYALEGELLEQEKLVKSHFEKLGKIRAEGTDARDILAQTGKGSEAENRDVELAHMKEAEAAAKRQADFQHRAEEELQKFRQSGLERFGTESEKLASKQSREMNEAWSKFGNFEGAAEAREALEAQHAVERMKSSIAESEREVSLMGAPAGMSAGAVRNSSAGVRAINRAASGTNSEQSIAKQALETNKKSLGKLEEIARKKLEVKMVSLSG